MKSIITARMKTAALAGVGAALLIAGAANVSTGGESDDANGEEQKETTLADQAAASLTAAGWRGTHILEGSGRASRRATSASRALTPGQRLTVEAVCLGAGSVTITATVNDTTQSRKVPCSESGTARARFTLTTRHTGAVQVAVEPGKSTTGGFAFCVRGPA